MDTVKRRNFNRLLAVKYRAQDHQKNSVDESVDEKSISTMSRKTTKKNSGNKHLNFKVNLSPIERGTLSFYSKFLLLVFRDTLKQDNIGYRLIIAELMGSHPLSKMSAKREVFQGVNGKRFNVSISRCSLGFLREMWKTQKISPNI